MTKLFSFVLCLMLAGMATAAAAPVFPKSSGVGLEPPAGMHEADRFLGFIDGLASIVITELPSQAYAQVAAKKERFAAKIEDGKLRDFSVPGAQAFLVVGRQQAAGHIFRKWAVVLGDATETAIVTAQVPVDDMRYTDAAIDAALHTIVVRAKPDVAAQVAALPFTIGDTAGFRPLLTTAGNAELLTDGPLDRDPAFTQPIAVVDVDFDIREAPPEADREDFAKRRFLDVTGRHVRDVAVTDTKVSKEGAAETVRIDATGVKPPSQKPAALIGFMRFADGGFVRTLCIVPEA